MKGRDSETQGVSEQEAVMGKTTQLTVQKFFVTVIDDYISLTDMARARTDSSRAADVIKTGCVQELLLNFLELGK